MDTLDYEFRWLAELSRLFFEDEWVNNFKIQITGIKDPGWEVKIFLEDTIYSEVTMTETDRKISDSDFINVTVENSVYYGFGDPSKLYEILKTFRLLITDFDQQNGFEQVTI